ncbi:hypothetical protein K1T71_002732 [Dendrolimus kikuchii]|uniref:Uncharacterized protein n=1 Tax=Dendrolimus kikuchii TaxID=765133 RepID=A0ACC1DDS5_9NEOP|nr:hypothetical protein K1T71_002732 [Dendrolimus kikuchii]
MSLTFRALFRNFNYIQNITKPVKCSFAKNYPIRVLCSGIRYHNYYIQRPIIQPSGAWTSSNSLRLCATQSGNNSAAEKPTPEPNTKKPGLIQRFKQMYRDYWYVLLPVHMATSAIWFGSFYYTVRSGVDIIGLLETVGFSETILEPIKNSKAGYFAFAFALYKLVTPLRYAVTVGGTTYAIRRLTALGWIKPVPSRERIKEMLQEKKENLQDRFTVGKQHYQTHLKEKRTHMMEEMKRYKLEMRNMKNKTQEKQ